MVQEPSVLILKTVILDGTLYENATGKMGSYQAFQ